MITVQNLTTTDASGRTVDHLSFEVHPGPLSGPRSVGVDGDLCDEFVEVLEPIVRIHRCGPLGSLV